MVSITREFNELAPDSLVSLFEFDTTPIIPAPTGFDSVYYTNTECGSAGSIDWDGETYLPFPFSFKGIENKSDGTALARPTLTVSNVNKTFFAIFLSLGDLTGVSVKRTITAYKFCDGQSEANPLATLSVNEFVITKKISQNKFEIAYELSSSLDRPGLKLPRRVILRNFTRENLFAPGVSRTRLR